MHNEADITTMTLVGVLHTGFRNGTQKEDFLCGPGRQQIFLFLWECHQAGLDWTLKVLVKLAEVRLF